LRSIAERERLFGGSRTSRCVAGWASWLRSLSLVALEDKRLRQKCEAGLIFAKIVVVPSDKLPTMTSKLLSVSLVAMFAWTGCSSDTGAQPPTGSGGHVQTGGNSGNGGTSGSGGAVGSGGTSGLGGASGSGGASASGGSGAGGISATGGKVGSGGSATGGSSSATGGTTAAGGSVAGGTTSKGGTSGTGGLTGNGGSTGKGGATGNGGSGVGGTTGNGGTSGSTGGASSGGTTGAGGGTTVVVTASGLPAPATGGVAQPTGAGSTVTVVDWAGFKGAISFNFDDTNQTQIDHYQEMQALNDKGNNVRYTFYLQTNKTKELGSTVWPQAVKDGHELGNHTKSHASAASATDIQAAEDTIQQMFGVTAYSIAAPNGDASYQTAAKGKFLTNRTAGDNGAIAMTDNPDTRQFTLPCILPASGASTSAMTGPIDTAVKAGKWSTLLIHGFSGGSDGAYNPVDFSNWSAAVKWAKEQGNIWIDTVVNVSSYWIGAYRFNKLTPTASGSDKVWTWKISDFNTPFPPGKYLRVKTDGGSLKQGSTTLQWDEHGYYEVSLDAGTLTLSP
jgi:peptidoglycan/xylan/chitin deacetylase (PgdA/CDA1 family)